MIVQRPLQVTHPVIQRPVNQMDQRKKVQNALKMVAVKQNQKNLPPRRNTENDVTHHHHRPQALINHLITFIILF